MTVQGLILFILGIIFILLGAGLMVYSSLAKRVTAGTRGETQVGEGKLKVVLDFVFEVLKLIAGFIPADKVAQVGFVLLIIGIGLVLLPVLIPGL
jgi:hypothetical protein